MNKKKGNFFLLPNDIFESDITAQEFFVLSYLVRCKDKQNQCWPSRATIAKNCKIKCMSSLDKYLQGLEDKGYISKTKRYSYDGKRQLSNIYTINKFE